MTGAARVAPGGPGVIREGRPLHDLGHGRLTGPPHSVDAQLRRDPGGRGGSRPLQLRIDTVRQRGWNSLACDAWRAKRWGGATPPRCTSTEARPGLPDAG